MVPDRVRGLALWLHRCNYVRFFLCPECGFVADKPDQLGVHIERHRETTVPFGSKKLRQCPKGCGRIFRLAPTSRSANAMPLDLKEHASMCDGSRPIPIPSEATPALDAELVMQYVSEIFRSQREAQWHKHPSGLAAYDDESGLLKIERSRKPPQPLRVVRDKVQEESMEMA